MMNAELAQCAYDTSNCPLQWNIVDPFDIDLFPGNFSSNGFSAVLLHNPVTNEFVLSFAGTSFFSVHDWVSNIQNHLNLANPEQYELAVDLAREVATALALHYPGATLSFTGHSLGGGLASIGALATGNEAVIFNSTTISQNALDQNNVQSVGHTNSIVAINTVGDPVNHVQQDVGQPAFGTHIDIGDPAAPVLVSSHGISTVQDELVHLYNENCLYGQP